VPAGSLPLTYLLDGVSFDDGSSVLVGQTGIYTKFGQGPSRLWLLRIDRDGAPSAQAFIDQGRMFPSSRDLIARCGDGVIVPYTTHQLPPISMVPGNLPPLEFGVRLAGFNAQLAKLWDRSLSSTPLPGSATCTGPAPPVILVASGDELLMKCVDQRGEQLWQVRVATPESFVTPVATLRVGNDLVAVCNHRPLRPAAGEAPQNVLLVVVKWPGSNS
jgi:hypothetical protein